MELSPSFYSIVSVVLNEDIMLIISHTVSIASLKHW